MVLSPLSHLRLLTICILTWFAAYFALNAQEIPPPQFYPQQASTRASAVFDQAPNAAVFIYDDQATPCVRQPARNLPPLGTGFIVHLEDRALISSTRQRNGLNFLVTAKHVIAERPRVIISLHSDTAPPFICHALDLQNSFFAAPGIDLAAVGLPEIPDADPTLISSSLLIDARAMKEWNIADGTDAFTAGYLASYDRRKINAPVTRYARVSLITEKWWYHNPESKRIEQAYELELSSALALSGAPVFAYGTVTTTNPFRYERLQPFVLGVVKDFYAQPVRDELISARRVAVLEPGANLKLLMETIARTLNP